MGIFTFNFSLLTKKGSRHRCPLPVKYNIKHIYLSCSSLPKAQVCIPRARAYLIYIWWGT